MGRDHNRDRAAPSSQSFNPRARVGRDFNCLDDSYTIDGFNPRARVGRDKQFTVYFTEFGQFQSTRPRGARPTMRGGSAIRLPVSIHAPAWGATHEGLHIFKPSPVSIHAPAWGATLCFFLYILFVSGFNPRARVGRDGILFPTFSYSSSFNPRARVGRDAFWRQYRKAIISFNPRARVGRDINRIGIEYVEDVFQSTRPRGARLTWIMSQSIMEKVSIHAPAWGATCLRVVQYNVYEVSIHAPAWGATDAMDALTGVVEFQSTRPRGARPHLWCPVLYLT